MMLIADSGGSTIDWKLIHPDGRTQSVTSSGFNPYNQPISDLQQTVEKNIFPRLTHSVQRIFFYGAGVTSKENKQAIISSLKSLFPQSVIEVQSDLLGAARALCGNAKGIVCILGTGSNCGWYGRKIIYRKTPSLGWALGDEGSGAYIGKKLVTDYLHKKTPPVLTRLFANQYPWSEDKFLQNIYRGNQPASFLGSFSPFVANHIKNPYCHRLVCSGFENFYKKNVTIYDNYSSLKVYFTGSVAFYYRDLLSQVAQNMNITIEHIAKSPIDGLVKYHQKDQSKKS